MINDRDVSFFNPNANSVEADKKTIVLTKLAMPFGELLVGASTKGICLLEFTDTQRLEVQLPRLKKAFSCQLVNGSSPFFILLHQQLQDFFRGHRSDFKDIPLELRGTDFQLKVWEALRDIPYGETRSYQQQAHAISHPKAVRAVANANRNNRISILIPCHRVIGKNGSMTGYGGGLWRKEYLLKLEGSLQKS